MGAQKKMLKKVLLTLFPYISYIKTERNMVYRYLETKIFSREKYPSSNAINIKQFLTLSYNDWRFLGITKLFNP